MNQGLDCVLYSPPPPQLPHLLPFPCNSEQAGGYSMIIPMVIPFPRQDPLVATCNVEKHAFSPPNTHMWRSQFHTVQSAIPSFADLTDSYNLGTDAIVLSPGKSHLVANHPPSGSKSNPSMFTSACIGKHSPVPQPTCQRQHDTTPQC